MRPGGTATPVERPALQPIDPVLQTANESPSDDDAVDQRGVIGTPVIITGADATVPESYTVQAGDTLLSIAQRFGIPLEELMAMNSITDPNSLQVGQVVKLPTKINLAVPFQRLIPDSELVLGPAYAEFDVRAFVETENGLLANYSESAEGEELDGVQIVERVSQRYSVGPRVLLALLEYHSGWVTQSDPAERAYPMGVQEPARAGLFYQLSWAAIRLNEGYYDRVDGRNEQLVFKDGTRALYDAETNPGTIALQRMFAAKSTPDEWSAALSADGFYAAYERLFGDPWQYAVTVIPTDLKQPLLVLPWKEGETWYYTGGPHGGWNDTSSWAALDFVPSDRTGCGASSFPARAISPGLVIRSENGEVVVDMDGDGFVGTGWTIFYMHMATAGRVQVGTTVAVGDPIGFPACEGGYSTAAHLHLARRYNGEWLAAGVGDHPFEMNGWHVEGAASPYDGYLVRGEQRLEACNCRDDGINRVSGSR